MAARFDFEARIKLETLLPIPFSNMFGVISISKIAEILAAECYFAKPDYSYHRGSNENANGMIR